MDWHRTPKDEAWRKAHLAMLAKLSMGLMLRCECCNRIVLEDARLFAARHGLAMETPLLKISRRLRCTQCGGRRGRATPEPSNGRPRG
jgi:hypothetical protein